MVKDPFRELREDRPDEDLGEFDWSIQQLHIQRGEWFPGLETALIDELDGSTTHYWNRWEHRFVLGLRGVVATYWYNEFEYSGGRSQKRLLDDRPDVDLVVTAADDVIAALRPLVEALTARFRGEAEVVPVAQPITVPPSDTWAAARAILIGQARPWVSIWPWMTDETIEESELEAAEASRGVRLPALMRTMLLERNGGRMRGYFDDDNWVNQHDVDIRPFGGLDHTPWFYDRQMTPDDWKPTRPLSLLIPFTGDGHADVCLDYRRRGPEREPEITLVDNESERITPVTDSFPAYVALLIDQELRLPAAPGATTAQLIEQLTSDFPEVSAEEGYGGRIEVSSAGQGLCQLRENKLLLEYSDCEYIVLPERNVQIGDLCRSLHGAGLLEGSLPQQTWVPS